MYNVNCDINFLMPNYTQLYGHKCNYLEKLVALLLGIILFLYLQINIYFLDSAKISILLINKNLTELELNCI